ncbi:MAG: hypothetical protein AB1730_04875 [Myxococcota bacterium]|jgi:serine/threonine-protein kinase
MTASAPSVGRQTLREHLEKDAPAREASVARFMAFATGASAVLALLLADLIGWWLSVAPPVMLAAMSAWYAVQLTLLKRRWFHPAVPWVNVALEVSAPALIFLVDLFGRGAEDALHAPPLVIRGTLVALSALRGSMPLAITAGALAAVEYLGLYFRLAYERLAADALVTLQPPLIATRAFLLLCAGLVTAAFVGHFNRRAEEALAAVRAKDVLGKDLLHERIGAGGMAEVYRATSCPEGGFEKTVAGKKILSGYAGDEDFVALFRQEAALRSRLNHPNIVQVLDFGRFGDTYFLAMEQPLRAPSTVRPEVPKAVDAIVLGLLERDLSRRTATAGHAADALAALIGPAAMAPQGQALLAEALREAAMLATGQSAAVSRSDTETLPATARH